MPLGKFPISNQSKTRKKALLSFDRTQSERKSLQIAATTDLFCSAALPSLVISTLLGIELQIPKFPSEDPLPKSNSGTFRGALNDEGRSVRFQWAHTNRFSHKRKYKLVWFENFRDDLRLPLLDSSRPSTFTIELHFALRLRGLFANEPSLN